MTDTQEQGHWRVDPNTDDTAVVIEFAHLGEEGVEQFVTAMTPHDAYVFGAAVQDEAMHMALRRLGESCPEDRPDE